MNRAAPILVVGLSVPTEKEQAFNEFYEHSFLPRLMSEIPEFTGISRYEELGVESTAPGHSKQYITIYDMDASHSVEEIDAIFGRLAVADVVKSFRQWKDADLKNFSRILYRPTWSHHSQSKHPSLPWLFVRQFDLKTELNENFPSWYEHTYLPQHITGTDWSGCNYYTSVSREPVRHLTMFEAPDEDTLLSCLAILKPADLDSENDELRKRVEAASTWHEAKSFRPIFLHPLSN